MRLLSRKLDDPDVQQWQPGLYAVLIGLGLIVAYVIAFVIENRRQVSFHFVFFTSHVSLIWLIILSLAIGVLGGVLLSQLHRRRSRN